MAVLNPLAKHYCSDKEYEILKRWTESHNDIKDMKNDIDTKSLERDLLDIKNTIDKSIAKIFN